MRRTLIRMISVGVLTGALVAVTAGSAFAAHGHGRFAPRFGFQGGKGGPGPGNLFGMGGGFGGPGMRGGGGFGGPGGPGGPGGGAGVLNADVLGAAATCLSTSVCDAHLRPCEGQDARAGGAGAARTRPT